VSCSCLTKAKITLFTAKNSSKLGPRALGPNAANIHDENGMYPVVNLNHFKTIWTVDFSVIASVVDHLSYKTKQKSVPEIIDRVFAKTSQNARFLLSENERFGLVFVKTGSINSGTEELTNRFGGIGPLISLYICIYILS
jgi:hypothetical protein